MKALVPLKTITNLEEEKIRLEKELKRINDQKENQPGKTDRLSEFGKGAMCMIHETLMKLRETDDNIRGLKRLISDLRGIRGGALKAASSSGFGRPTEARAIKVVELEEALTSAELDRMCLLGRLEEEKAGCPDELVWKLLWDHFYLGYPWKKTGLRHGMKESATKMRALRFLKKLGVYGPAAEQAGKTLGEPPA